MTKSQAMLDQKHAMAGSDATVVRLRRTIGVFALLLVCVTFPLWCDWKQSAGPRVPWFEFLRGIPVMIDSVFLFGLVIGSLWMLFGTSTAFASRASSLLFAISSLCLVLLDQHRLQPWMLQFVVSAMLLGLQPNTSGLRLDRWFICSIYLYSALSKFDHGFLQVQGPMLLDGGLQGLGVKTQFWAESTKQVAPLIFPVGELLVTVLLFFSRTRTIGLWSSVAMHIILLWTLGPTGLNHEYGVLCWNAFFIAQNFLLFHSRKDSPVNSVKEPTRQSHNTPTATLIIAYAIAGIVMVGPLLENWNLYDHWPAWAVYSSRPAQVRVKIKESEVRRLPEHLRMLTVQKVFATDTVSFNLDQWSFQTRHCPVYPQLRYRLALALALLQDIPDDAITIEVQSTPDRWTGRRQVTTLSGRKQIEEYCNKFWLNTVRRRV